MYNNPRESCNRRNLATLAAHTLGENPETHEDQS